jgi:hypothetical protein
MPAGIFLWTQVQVQPPHLNGLLLFQKVDFLEMLESMFAQLCSPSAITSVTRCKPIHGRSAKTSMFSMVTAAITPVSLLFSIEPLL